MRMINLILSILAVSMLISCENDSAIERTNNKLKKMYIYSDSDAEDPYSFTKYFYDNNGNLIKELISDYPEPVYASFNYEYSSEGKLISKKRKAIEGASSPNQTEEDFVLIWEKKYKYTGNKKIEKEYSDNKLTDSAIYVYDGELLIEETHYDIEDSEQWSIEYKYNSNDNLIKENQYPDSIYTKYIYEDEQLHKTLQYDKHDSLLVENLYIYSSSGDKEITEVHYKGPYGEFIKEKITYQFGNKIEHIKYHSTFQGEEWWVKRYEYH